MQTGKKVVESVKETTSNIAATARSGMEKAKATAQEKVDKLRADDDYEKDLATQHKQERLAEAELRKQEAYSQNAAQKHAATADTTAGSYSHSTTGATGQSTGVHQMSALPGHGTGQPAGGYVEEGTAVGSHPIGKGTGTAGTTRTTTAQNRHAGRGTNTGLTGSGYSG